MCIIKKKKQTVDIPTNQIVEEVKQENSDKIIILGTAHLKSTPGKCSPDGKFKEYEYSRYICKEVQKRLISLGYTCFIDCIDDEIPYKELEYRVQLVNKYCKQYGSKNCLYVSIHSNAAGNGKEWKNAQGWSVYIYRNASEKSRKLAEYLFDECKGLKTRKETPSRKYWESGLYVCKNTNCPAVLTENFFQDNKDDVKFLLSDEGKEKIINIHVNGIINYIKNELS